MSQEETDEKELIRQAMQVIGRAKTPRKLEALAKNREKFTGHTPETKAKIAAAQAARRERERQERIAAGIVDEPKEPKKRGRPRKTEPTAKAATNGRGRPRRVNATADTPHSTQGILGANEGTE